MRPCLSPPDTVTTSSEFKSSDKRDRISVFLPRASQLTPDGNLLCWYIRSCLSQLKCSFHPRSHAGQRRGDSYGRRGALRGGSRVLGCKPKVLAVPGKDLSAFSEAKVLFLSVPSDSLRMPCRHKA